MMGVLRAHQKGFTLYELLIVLAIMSTLIALAGLAYSEWRKRYDLESQVRMVHADLLSVRVQAMQKNRTYFIDLQAASYAAYEDKDDSGDRNAADGDPLWTKPLRYRVTSTPELIEVDGRGLLGPKLAYTVTFDAGGVTAALDCLAINPTRIKVGKYHGTSCSAK